MIIKSKSISLKEAYFYREVLFLYPHFSHCQYLSNLCSISLFDLHMGHFFLIDFNGVGKRDIFLTWDIS